MRVRTHTQRGIPVRRHRIATKCAASLLTLLLCLGFVHDVLAANSNTYAIPSDVQAVGGGDVSKSGNYLLDDTIGEGNIGPSRSPNYDINAGYRQTTFLSLGCTSDVNLGSIPGTGQKSGSGTCIVNTDATAGYTLSWISGSSNTNGLAAYWNMDETTGTVAFDGSGNGNNLTYQASPTVSTAVPSPYFSVRSRGFNGSSQYASTTDTTYLDLTNRFTTSMWVKAANTSQTNRYLLSKLNDAGSDNVWSMIFGYVSSSVEFYASGYTGTDPRTGSQIALPDTNWHHVTYTYDGTTWSGYLDGAVVFSVARTFSLAPSAGAFNIATFNGGGFFFTGNIDDVRIYNRSLRSEEVLDLASRFPPGSMVSSTLASHIPPINYPATGGVLALWKMDDVVGTIGTDSSGNGRDGTHTGGVSISTTIPTNTIHRTIRSLNFNGTSGYVDVGSVPVNIGASFSIGGWIKAPQARSDYRVILSKGPKNTGHFEVYQNISDGTLMFYSNDIGNVSSGVQIDDDTWHHFGITYDGATMRFYVDGTLVASPSASGTVAPETETLYIGKQVDTGGTTMYFSGYQDDLRIYSRVLTAAEIKALASLPQTWSVDTYKAAWGARLRSSSSDTDARWGTDASTDKWLNVGDGTYSIISRGTRTSVSGSNEYIDFRAEVGAGAIQPASTYTATIILTALSL